MDDITICGKHKQCFNTQGSYSCVCNPGIGLKSGKAQFTGNGESCEEITDQKATTDQTATTDSEDAQGAKGMGGIVLSPWMGFLEILVGGLQISC